jgi:hypothetical protein
MKKTFVISIIAALAVMASLATTAFAQSSADGYSDSGGQIQTQVAGSGGGGGNPPADTPATTVTPVSDSSGSTLPFTGLDVALLVGAGGLLVAAGFGMRRLTRAPDAA